MLSISLSIYYISVSRFVLIPIYLVSRTGFFTFRYTNKNVAVVGGGIITYRVWSQTTSHTANRSSKHRGITRVSEAEFGD
jgi:hypothetical protein